MTTRHAAKLEDSQEPLCALPGGKLTKPKEVVNCPRCRAILNNLRRSYPEHAEYTDWRATKEEMREAARDMYRDLVGGEIEG